jgi:putative ABC transport system permease protein
VERRLLSSVAMLQVALTFALLAGAVLLIRTVKNLAQIRPGFDTENILALTVTAVQRENWKEFHLRALERVAALPGVKHAAFIWGLPLTGNKWEGNMEILGQENSIGSSPLERQINLPLRSASPDYFEALGIKIVEGRGFRSSDNDQSPRVAIINQAFVARHFSNRLPIGSKLRFSGDTNRTIEVVGIVSDTRTDGLSEAAEPEIYFPFWQNGAYSKHLIVRTASDPRPLAAMIQPELRAIDPTAAVEHIKTMEEIRQESIAPRTFAMRLLVGFSFVAGILSLVGIYGMLSLSVGSRIKEVAVRMAIGAQWHQILRLVLAEAFRPIALGLIFGSLVALWLGRILGAFLFGVTPADPATLVEVALSFAAVALLASAVPALRAVRTDPMEALRYE